MKTNGIVALTNPEIDRVAGGKSAVDRFWESISRWMDGLGGPPGTMTVPLGSADILELARMFENSGGSVAQSGSLSSGTVSIRLTSGDGEFTFVNVTGIR